MIPKLVDRELLALEAELTGQVVRPKATIMRLRSLRSILEHEFELYEKQLNELEIELDEKRYR